MLRRKDQKTLPAVAAVAAALAVVVAVPAILMSDAASAHPSDCHAQQTCPSDDHSYVWYDGAGNAWDCAEGTEAGATAIVHDGVTYACRPADPVEPPTTTGTTTGPTETVPPPPPLITTTPRAPPRPPRATVPKKKPAARPSAANRSPARITFRAPPRVTPKLTAGGYVFPVYGPSGFVDTFAAARATVSWHHGEDIFAAAGAPVLAVADGTVFSVGWNDIGGLRLWLRDRQGNEFYYAHLSAFSPFAVNGAQVRAGTVLGFVGTTGDAVGTPPHLHFEIHPVSLLHLGYDGAVRPFPYLQAWKRLEDLPIGARGAELATLAVGFGPPKAGAVLLEAADISTASGLEPGSLRRALSASARVVEFRVPRGVDAAALQRAAERAAALARALAEKRLQAQAAAFARRESPGSVGFGFGVWDLLAACEAGGDWHADTGNGYAGGLQFAPETWAAYGGLTYATSAAAASREEQISVARLVLAGQGWGAWPACSRRLGLR